MGNPAATYMTESDKPSKKVVIEQRVRDVLANEEFKFSSDFFDALNSRVETLVKDAATRCKLNGRVTLQSQDV